MNVREMSDTELLGQLFALSGRRESYRTPWNELLRRLARNPRCPTCGKEQPVCASPCGTCATDGVEVNR